MDPGLLGMAAFSLLAAHPDSRAGAERPHLDSPEHADYLGFAVNSSRESEDLLA